MSLHISARIEDRVYAVLERVLRRRGWRPRVLAYVGYGTQEKVRVLARVLLAPPGSGVRDLENPRGWRHFVSVKAPDVPVTIRLGENEHVVRSARGGYVDVDLPSTLPAGWNDVPLSVPGSRPSVASIHVVGASTRLGLVSDIDDTVIITALPRPLVALRNTFLSREAARRPVPGMADLYRHVQAEHPDTFFVYLSTGAWNVAPVLERFLAVHGYPRGPLLMTDWGPTAEGWFRSGTAHKRNELRRLLADLPQLSWMLVGDDGQHDPALYDEVVAAAPARIRSVLIRQLSPAEQVLTHGTPLPRSDLHPVGMPQQPPTYKAPDGHGLLAALGGAPAQR